jgi:transcriptional regulator GlxA family with amidase domain
MAARVLLIEEALLALLNQNGYYDYTVEECLRRIEAHSGNLSVAQLARDLGISSRQLTRRFQNTVGLSPKEFARVSRFLNVLRCLSEDHKRSLTETALVCGYFDQAHLNHEFREMAGMAPGELFTFPNVAF